MISFTRPNSSTGIPVTILFLMILLCANPLLAEPLDIAFLQRLALKNNPKIKAMESEVRMAAHRIEESRSLEDIKLTFAVNSLPLDTFSFRDEDMTSKEIGLSQMIPLWGKLAIRERIAELDRLKRFEALRKERISMSHQLRQSVYEMRGALASKALLTQIQSQLGLLINSETALSKTGMGTLSGVINANIESIMVDEKQLDLDQKVEALRARITYFTGADVKEPPSISATLLKEIPAETVKAGIKENPELKMASYDTLMSREEMRLREKEFYPDMEAGISYMQRDNTSSVKRADMVSAMVSFNIPVWVKGKKAGVEEMKSKKESNEQTFKDKMNDLEQQAKILMADMEKSRKIHGLYSGRVIPQAELEFESALASYRTSGGLVTVIEKLKALLAFQNELVISETSYLVSCSELSALIGIEVVE